MKRIMILASGNGTNAENLIKFFQDKDNASVILVLTNNPKAKVIDRCNTLKVSCLCFNKSLFRNDQDLLSLISAYHPDLIVLAGFLWKIPMSVTEAFPDKIINIHPALLPKYGGKGMYGMHVHRAVVANKETESGITIHFVNEYYDDGQIIFQAKCPIHSSDSAEDVAMKIHELEMIHFPRVVESLLTD